MNNIFTLYFSQKIKYNHTQICDCCLISGSCYNRKKVGAVFRTHLSLVCFRFRNNTNATNHLKSQNTSIVPLTVPRGSTWVRENKMKAFVFSEISPWKSLQEFSVSFTEFKDVVAAADPSHGSCCYFE